jgi:hypothetical protein
MIPDRDVCQIKTVLGDEYTVDLPFHRAALAVGRDVTLRTKRVYEETTFIPPVRPREPGTFLLHDYGQTIYHGGWRYGQDGPPDLAINGRHIVSITVVRARKTERMA